MALNNKGHSTHKGTHSQNPTAKVTISQVLTIKYGNVGQVGNKNIIETLAE